MAKYYLSFSTVKALASSLNASADASDLLTLISQASEFEVLPVVVAVPALIMT